MTRTANGTGSRSEDRPRLYVVATSHLDSQWRWTIQTTIRHFLRRTLLDNFDRLHSFPDYVLSFEGAFRYRLAEEYYPQEFRQLARLVRIGRWQPAGAMLDAPDTNLPSPESLIRHILYGNDYFESRFGRRCADLFLPDCFGFPWSLPTIAAHCGLLGFSSQKLIKWRSPAKTPFDIGLWEGPDGARIIAVLNPGGYGDRLREDLSRSPDWRSRLEKQRLETGLAVGCKYFGLGDRGGAPDCTTLDFLEKSLGGGGDIEVIHGASDQIFRDLTVGDRGRLPVHRGELLLPTHGTGCWTSHAVLKKWNRRCELLGEAAERAALAATWLGGQDYPDSEIRTEWSRFLWHQMHDDLTGTSSPEAYRWTSNDLILVQNRFSTILHSSVATVARGLDTSTEGIPVVVFNALGFDRSELVDVWLRFDSPLPATVRIVDPDGAEVLCQELEREADRVRVVFRASVPSVGFAVFRALAAAAPPNPGSDLSVSTQGLENARYRVAIDAAGAIRSLHDKRLGRDLLKAPMDIVLLPDNSARWPAWEIRHEDICSEARTLEGAAAIRIVESGPVRAKLEISRTAGASTFVQTLSLDSSGDASRLEIGHDIHWRSSGKLLKAVFPVALDHPTATYDMGLGAIERGINTRSQYEVPGHEWVDLSGPEWGFSILSRHKYGWDRPDAGTLRLSLLRSPKALRKFAHQATQDFGHHRFAYAVESHAGGWSPRTVAHAAGFNQPLYAFQAAAHPGGLGRKLSVLRLDGDGAQLMALKKAENSDHWLTRVRETAGATSSRIELSAASPFVEAIGVDGCERSPAPIDTTAGRLKLDLPRFGPRSVLLDTAAPKEGVPTLDQAVVELPFDVVATSFHGRGGADFDGDGCSFPGELFPERLRAGALAFRLGPNLPGVANAASCRGQEIELPAGDFDRLTVLATSTDPKGAPIRFPGSAHPTWVPYYSGFVGQWKLFSGRLGFLLRRWRPGFIERTPVAWVASHRHDRAVRNHAYTYCYLFLFEFELVPGAPTLELPRAPGVKIFAATASSSARWALEPAARFYD